MSDCCNDVHDVEEGQCAQTDVKSHWFSHILNVVQV